MKKKGKFVLLKFEGEKRRKKSFGNFKPNIATLKDQMVNNLLVTCLTEKLAIHDLYLDFFARDPYL